MRTVAPLTEQALDAVRAERRHQEARWGTQRHGLPVWQTILTEEVGEVAAAILKLRATPLVDVEERRRVCLVLHHELAQVAAVAVAAMEHITEVFADGRTLEHEVWR